MSTVGSINSIRIVNPGGFYKKRLPVVSNIISSRKIERVEINEPGTQYNVGTYNGIAIAGDGEGGLASVTVANTLNNEGVTVPGQVTDVTITSPGKGYTTASIDTLMVLQVLVQILVVLVQKYRLSFLLSVQEHLSLLLAKTLVRSRN